MSNVIRTGVAFAITAAVDCQDVGSRAGWLGSTRGGAPTAWRPTPLGTSDSGIDLRQNRDNALGTLLPMTRSRRLAAAIAALVSMFFAQAAFALAACDPAGMPSRAQMLVAQSEQYAPCHEPADNVNLCLAHCQSAEQTLDKHQVKVPDASFQAALVLQSWPPASPRASSNPRAPTPFAGPPPRILFRTLLI